MNIQFKVILWGGVKFPTGGKVHEERCVLNIARSSRFGEIPIPTVQSG